MNYLFAVLIILYFNSLQLNPMLKPYVVLPLLLIAMMVIINAITKKKAICVAIPLILASVIFLACIYPIAGTSETDDAAYIALSDKMTGIGETKVYYYKLQNIFIADRDPSYAENYGIVLTDWSTVMDGDPISVEYFN